MRQETNNEMDLLLRRLGRRDEPAASDDHLDADELSSYAENVLPPAARARYTEHLAECARCRDLVVQLSGSAGVVAAQATVKAVGLSGFRKFLASIFSPMVLRYAVPALGLVVVAAIGLMVSRNRAPQADIAQLKEQDRMPASVTASAPQPSASSGGFSGLEEGRTAAKEVPPTNKATETGPTAQQDTAPVTKSVSPEVRQEAPKTEDEQKSVANEAPPPAKPGAVMGELRKLESEQQKQKGDDRAGAAANEPAPAEKTAEDNKKEVTRSDVISLARARESKSRSQPLATLSPHAGAATAQRDEEATRDKDDAATKTVAGRRFRKEGNVWVDTAYSSQSMTIIKRGSEQYRGLVADEPALKTIADQLDGEVIVVWKGRTYKIQ